EIGDQVENNAVEFGDKHLVNLVLENVAIPGHAVCHHDKGRAFLDELAGEQRMHAEVAWSVPFAIFSGKLIEIEEIGTAHQAFDAGEDGVLRSGGGTGAVVFVFAREETAKRFALFEIFSGDVGEAIDV